MTPRSETLGLDPAEIDEVDLVVVTRVQALVHGEHPSVFTGTGGSDFSGIREWEPGDARSRIDWAHSTRTAFSPLAVRECVEPRSVDVLIGVDTSLSSRCGLRGVTIGRIAARAVATLGFSATIFQDAVGLIVFDGKHAPQIEPPRRGRGQVFRLLELLDSAGVSTSGSDEAPLAEAIGRELRHSSFVVILSDFLFPSATRVVRELAELKPPHDVVLGVIDSAFAFDLPPVSTGWVECVDVETGQAVMLSRRSLAHLPSGVERHQSRVVTEADRHDVDVVRLGNDPDRLQNALIELFLERRLRRR